jgi:hypothetical protein
MKLKDELNIKIYFKATVIKALEIGEKKSHKD